jgi:hypothetical protein
MTQDSVEMFLLNRPDEVDDKRTHMGHRTTMRACSLMDIFVSSGRPVREISDRVST